MPLDAYRHREYLPKCNPPNRYDLPRPPEGFESDGEKGWSKRFDEQIVPA
jgi:hypothetical protein